MGVLGELLKMVSCFILFDLLMSRGIKQTHYNCAHDIWGMLRRSIKDLSWF